MKEQTTSNVGSWYDGTYLKCLFSDKMRDDRLDLPRHTWKMKNFLNTSPKKCHNVRNRDTYELIIRNKKYPIH